MCTAPLDQINSFLKSLTGLTLNFVPKVPEGPYISRTPQRSRCTTPVCSIRASSSFRSPRESTDSEQGSLKSTLSMDSIFTDAFDMNKKDISRALSACDIKRRPRPSSDLFQYRRHSIGVNLDYPNGDTHKELNESDAVSQQ